MMSWEKGGEIGGMFFSISISAEILSPWILIVGSDAIYHVYDDEVGPPKVVRTMSILYEWGRPLMIMVISCGFTWIKKNFWASLFSEAICLIRSLFFSSTFMMIIFLSYSDHSPSRWRNNWWYLCVCAYLVSPQTVLIEWCKTCHLRFP